MDEPSSPRPISARLSRRLRRFLPKPQKAQHRAPQRDAFTISTAPRDLGPAVSPNPEAGAYTPNLDASSTHRRQLVTTIRPIPERERRATLSPLRTRAERRRTQRLLSRELAGSSPLVPRVSSPSPDIGASPHAVRITRAPRVMTFQRPRGEGAAKSYDVERPLGHALHGGKFSALPRAPEVRGADEALGPGTYTVATGPVKSSATGGACFSKMQGRTNPVAERRRRGQVSVSPSLDTPGASAFADDGHVLSSAAASLLARRTRFDAAYADSSVLGDARFVRGVAQELSRLHMSGA